jgi:MFS family permease
MKWKAQLNLLFISQFIIIACLDMSDPYWPLIVHHFNSHIATQYLQYWSAAIYIFPALITILTTPLWTHLGQRVGHKKMLLRACGALVVTQVLISFTTNLYLILIIRLLQGIFAGFTAAAQAWSINSTQTKSHSYVIGRMQSATAIGSVVGPIIGGLVANFSYSALFFISASIMSVIVILLAYFLQETPLKNIQPTETKSSSFFRIKKNLCYLLLYISCSQTARWMSSSFFALYVIDRLKGNNFSVGLLYSSTALAILLFAPRFGVLIDKKISEPKVVKFIFITVLLGASCAQFIFSVATNLYLGLLSSIVGGICIGAIALIPYTLLIAEADEFNKDRIIGLGSSASKLGNLIGIALGAFIQAEASYSVSFVCIGLLYCILAIFLLLPRLQLQCNVPVNSIIHKCVDKEFQLG